jgi:hypothetical protein
MDYCRRYWFWFVGFLAFVFIINTFINAFSANLINRKFLAILPIDTSTKKLTPSPTSMTVTNHTLPSDIYPGQTSQHYSYDGVDYLLYQRPNMNIYFPGEFTPESGILYANKGDIRWKKFLYIKETSTSKNNPYWLDYQNGILSLLIVDANGAGSGEGFAKLVLINPISRTWKTESCFYFSDGLFWSEDQGISLDNSVKDYLRTHPDYASFAGYSPSTGLYKEKSCRDFAIIFYIAKIYKFRIR